MSDTKTDESTETDEPIDITEKAHERGSEGQLLPVEKTVDGIPAVLILYSRLYRHQLLPSPRFCSKSAESAARRLSVVHLVSFRWDRIYFRVPTEGFPPWGVSSERSEPLSPAFSFR